MRTYEQMPLRFSDKYNGHVCPVCGMLLLYDYEIIQMPLTRFSQNVPDHVRWQQREAEIKRFILSKIRNHFCYKLFNVEQPLLLKTAGNAGNQGECEDENKKAL